MMHAIAPARRRQSLRAGNHFKLEIYRAAAHKG